MQRNSSGRFLSKSGSNKKNTRRSNSNSNRNAASVKVLQVTSPRQLRAAERLLGSGAGSLVLIWSPTCPHCHTYMPLWKELTKMSNKATNMISIRSDVYPELSLSSKKSVSGVPTVLYVNSEGNIQEIEEARNKSVMAKLVTKPEMPTMNNVTAPKMPPVVSAEPNIAYVSEPKMSNIPLTVPGTRTMPSELTVLPGSKGVSDVVVSEALEEMVPAQPVGSQRGGNFGSFVQAAGPAALLLGAYAAFGRTRSSGLPPAHRRTRRRQRSKKSKTRRHH